MPDEKIKIIVGVDTHTDTHTAVVIDLQGRRLDDVEIPATPGGYRQLLEWATTTEPSPPSGWKAPVPTGPGWPGSSPMPR